MFAVVAMAPSPALAKLYFCTVSATSEAFGSYNVFATTALTTTATVTIAGCFGTGIGTIAMNQGLHSSTFNPRDMEKSGGTDLLNYNLYTSAAHTTIWGDGTGGTATVTFTGDGTFTAYGQVPAGQNVSAGTSYTDSVTITISF
ncbi:MAG: spore coat U domain-containing protein [Candidatus Binataceae bacterium]